MQLSEKQAKAIASFANIAGDKNDPFALQCVKMTVSNGIANIYATNRYILANQSFEVDSEDLSVLFPPSVLRFFKTVKGVAEVVVSEDSISVSSLGESVVSPIHQIKYPPIEEMIVDNPVPVAQDKSFSLDFANLIKISKIVSSLDDKGSKNAYEFFTQGFNENKNAPKPIVMKRSNIVAIIQPMRVN